MKSKKNLVVDIRKSLYRFQRTESMFIEYLVNILYKHVFRVDYGQKIVFKNSFIAHFRYDFDIDVTFIAFEKKKGKPTLLINGFISQGSIDMTDFFDSLIGSLEYGNEYTIL